MDARNWWMLLAHTSRISCQRRAWFHSIDLCSEQLSTNWIRIVLDWSHLASAYTGTVESCGCLSSPGWLSCIIFFRVHSFALAICVMFLSSADRLKWSLIMRDYGNRNTIVDEVGYSGLLLFLTCIVSASMKVYSKSYWQVYIEWMGEKVSRNRMSLQSAKNDHW